MLTSLTVHRAMDVMLTQPHFSAYSWDGLTATQNQNCSILSTIIDASLLRHLDLLLTRRAFPEAFSWPRAQSPPEAPRSLTPCNREREPFRQIVFALQTRNRPRLPRDRGQRRRKARAAASEARPADGRAAAT